jgi:hypothetical protein
MLQSCRVPGELVMPGRLPPPLPAAPGLQVGAAVLALHPLSGLYVPAEVAASGGRPTLVYLQVGAAGAGCRDSYRQLQTVVGRGLTAGGRAPVVMFAASVPLCLCASVPCTTPTHDAASRS